MPKYADKLFYYDAHDQSIKVKAKHFRTQLLR